MAANNLLCLDVGEKRIGVAKASSQARLAEPLMTLINDSTIYTQIANLMTKQEANRLIVGLPRNASGDDTAQTDVVRRFVDVLQNEVRTAAIVLQDEADTSRKAEAELMARRKPYQKSDIDALAATYILQDYLDHNSGGAF